jgi:hypothetical protein
MPAILPLDTALVHLDVCRRRRSDDAGRRVQNGEACVVVSSAHVQTAAVCCKGDIGMSKQADVKEAAKEKTESGSAPPANGASRPGLGDDHPLTDIIGTYEGPTWERILKNIKRNRKRAIQEYIDESEEC